MYVSTDTRYRAMVRVVQQQSDICGLWQMNQSAIVACKQINETESELMYFGASAYSKVTPPHIPILLQWLLQSLALPLSRSISICSEFLTIRQSTSINLCNGIRFAVALLCVAFLDTILQVQMWSVQCASSATV